MSFNFPNLEEVFQNRYRIVSVINRGGFGRVYRAQQLELNRDVAIKVLQPITRDGMDAEVEASRLAIVKKRFEREAQLVSQLRDSHTVVMHDYGTTDEGLLYMVLEYIDGRPLDKVIEEEGALEPERVVRIARQILWSLQEAHALTMLHRDVKPQNIMLFDHAGRIDLVKVLDFGLAKSAESAEFRAEDPDLTGDQVILGTPRYMSPEQIRGEPLEPSSDLYSLGLVIFEMLCGYKAVGGESTMNTLARHLNDVPILLPDDVELPNGLRDIVNRMLTKQAAERLQSAEEVLEALEFWDTATSVLGETSDPADGTLGFVEDRRKRTLVWTAAAVLSLFLFVAVVSAAIGGDPKVVVPAPDLDEVDIAPPPQPVTVVVEPPPDPVPRVVQFEEGDMVKGDPPPQIRVAQTAPPPSTASQAVDPPEELVPSAAPDMGSALVTIELDAGSVAPADPVKSENKSTKGTNSGKKKKLELEIGILK